MVEIGTGCCTSVRDMRKAWLATIFCITKSSRHTRPTLAIIRQPLMYAAALSDLARLTDISTEIKLRASQSGGGV